MSSSWIKLEKPVESNGGVRESNPPPGSVIVARNDTKARGVMRDGLTLVDVGDLPFDVDDIFRHVVLVIAELLTN